MIIRTIILSFALLLAMSLPARDKTDVLVMKNGDRMTCQVKGLSAGVLYVAFDYIDGTVSVDWSKVSRLESSQLFVVKTQNGSVYTGTLTTPETAGGRPVKIQVVETRGQGEVLDRSKIVQMVATSESFWQRFSGEVSFGTTYTKGNQTTQYTLGSDVIYPRQRWSAEASFTSNLSSSAGVDVSTRNSLQLGVRRLLPWSNWFYSGVGGFLQSSEQGIALQSTVGGGIGRYLKHSDRTRISVLAGMALQNTNYTTQVTAPGNQNLGAALIAAEAKVFRFSRTNLDATATLMPALSDPGRLRFGTNVTYYIKIYSRLKWNFSFYGNWDNQPPPGFSGSDYGSSTGISWTFGLK